jgi:hypothetical protein
MKSETVGGGEGLSLEERKRRFWERHKDPIPDAPVKRRAVAVTVDPVTAENVRARPESVRIATRDESGATRISGPRRCSVDVGGSSAVGWMGWGPSGALGTERVWFEPEAKGDDKVSRNYDPIARFEEEERNR